jgi:hypothetical protein
VRESQSIEADSPRPVWEKWLVGTPGILCAFLWGLAEATFFFVIPDVFLSFVACLSWPRTWKHILTAIGGAVLGGALLFHWAEVNPGGAHASIARVPFIREHMLEKVDDGFRSRGLFSVFLGSVSGIPYKLYAVEAPKFSRERDFLLATPPARAIRFLLVWFAFGSTAHWLKRRPGWTTGRLLVVHAVIWIVSYAIYWGRILPG